MLPYFDIILEKIKKDDPLTKTSLGEHVHWGYWNNENVSNITPEKFSNAGERMLEKIINLSNIKNGQKILDVGSGLGGTIKYLNKKFENCEFVGLNIDDRQVEIARNATNLKNNNTIKFIQGDACELPFDNNTFDLILCVESIFHFDSRERFFKEANRVLKDSGMLALSDFVPTKLSRPFLSFLEKKFSLACKAYGKLDIDISMSKYNQISKKTRFKITSFVDVTKKTFPTYSFLQNIFSTTKEYKELKKATKIIEFFSRFGMLRYMIICFINKE